MKIEKKECSIRGDKRQNVPFVFRDDCPNCGEVANRDFGSDWYLSYPTFGEPTEIPFCCHDCDHEWRHMVVVDFTCKEYKPEE